MSAKPHGHDPISNSALRRAIIAANKQLPSASRCTMNSKLFYLAALLLLCGSADRCLATELWATDAGGSSSINLSQINIATGAVLSTKSISGLASATTNDFASDPIREPSLLWGVRWSAFVNQLVAIDPFQTQLLSSVQLNSPTPIKSLAIDPTDGVLYGAGGTSLYRIARATGTTTLVGNASTSLDRALSFDAIGNLYGISGSSLVTVDKSTGATNTVATLAVSLEDIAASPDNGTMYGLGLGSTYSLYQINLATGATTAVGQSLLRPSSLAFTALSGSIGDFNGDTIVDDRDYVVWRKRLGLSYTPTDYTTWRSHFGQSAGSGNNFTPVPIPEPGSILLLATALCLAATRNGSRRATNSAHASS
jgi:hypothetical protein